MSITEQIAQIASALPADRQQEVLDFAEFLRARGDAGGQEGGRPRAAGPFRRDALLHGRRLRRAAAGLLLDGRRA